MTKSPTRIGIDVGGTFTDLAWWDSATNELRTEKALTTQDVVGGIGSVLEGVDANLNDAHLFVHGTTLALNALLQGKGARTGLITTKGFADVLEIAREDRPWMYDTLYVKPRPLVQRRFRLEVEERVTGDGDVLKYLREEDVLACIATLKRNGISCIAVCLLHSYANPAHELRIGEIIAAEYPEAYYTLSHTILRQHYEYERTVSAVMNCQVQPIMRNYLQDLDRRLKDGAFGGTSMLLRSSGGAMTLREARETPVFTLMSGPAGGVLGATNLGKETGIRNMITADAGGTSFDVCLIADGEPEVSSYTSVDEYKLLLPVLDIRSIGAGGGSIAWIDQAGAPQVGPESAGSTPGPICYGRGGQRPTVTDAAVVLGILSPDYFLGGRMPLDVEGASRAIRSQIAEPLGLDLYRAAQGILRIVETKMAGAIREITVERGRDPREFTLVGFGGAGPLSVCNLARQLSMSNALVPVSPANFSARGMLSADLVYDYIQTKLASLDETPASSLQSTLTSMIDAGRQALARDGINARQQAILCSLDMKYWGQGEHSVTVPLRTAQITEESKAQLQRDFHKTHERMYGHRMDAPVQIVNFRVRAIGRTSKPTMPQVAAGGSSPRGALKGTRRAHLNGEPTGLEVPVYERHKLRANNRIKGPAIVEEATTTTLLGTDDRATVDGVGNLVIEVR